MRILGIDCGSQTTGYGVIESDGSRHEFVEAGAIETDPAHPFVARLETVGTRLREVIAKHAPDEAAVEDAFYAKNARSALKLAQVRGVALFVLAEAGITIGEYAPAVVKMAITGSGRAEKTQVQWMVRALLKLDDDIWPLDASDAVAVAICHATRRPAGAAR